ncbi:hypothetical protein JTB14_033733 [Gonioctena quinquepunctata]|nr:hypothetical protein JTB14_033733 [Gonioctena quinquepunctata]
MGTEILKMTELEKFSDKALTDNTVHHNYECRYEFIDPIKETFDKLHNNIVGIVSNQDNAIITAENDVLTAFENDYFYCQAVI